MRVDKRLVYHLVARVHRPDVWLNAPEIDAWVWARLRAAFPDALGCCVMPDHLHLAAPLDSPAAGQQRLNRLLGQLARRLGVPSVGDAPSADVRGTPPPRPAPSTALARFPLATIARAVAAAMRSPSSEIQRQGPVRNLFVALAFDQGWRSYTQLAEVCRCTPRTIRTLAARSDATHLSPARLCLGDPRLHSPDSSPFVKDRSSEPFTTPILPTW